MGRAHGSRGGGELRHPRLKGQLGPIHILFG
jgi:hypothetical protein